MAKANKKATKEDLHKTIDEGFDAFENGLRAMKDAAERVKMDLLAKNIEVDLAILEVYKKGWSRIQEE